MDITGKKNGKGQSDMGRIYTEAQKKASQNYFKKQSTIKMMMPEKEADSIRQEAKQEGKNIKRYVLDGIQYKKEMKQDMPNIHALVELYRHAGITNPDPITDIQKGIVSVHHCSNDRKMLLFQDGTKKVGLYLDTLESV